VTLRIQPLIITASVLLAAAAAPVAAQDGAAAFQQYCTSCHTIGAGRLVGPDLKGVSARKDRAWLTAFVLDPAAAIARKDPYALQLQREAQGIVMPTLPLDPALVGRLLDFIDSKSGEAGAAPAAPAEPPFTAADIAAGRAIFLGHQRLSGGGPGCVSCHTVRGVGGLGGGQLGPDLTRVFERLQGKRGLTAWLGAPATPTMQGVFARAPLTPKEVRPLVAFFESTARAGGQDTRAGQLNFALLGLGGAALGLVALGSAWGNRFRSVRRALVERARLPRD
jgi:mono/diheme cytochrome c family protein